MNRRLTKLQLTLARLHQRVSDPKQLVHAIARTIVRAIESPGACAVYSRAWPGDKPSLYCIHGQQECAQHLRTIDPPVQAARRNICLGTARIGDLDCEAAIIPLLAANTWYGSLVVVARRLTADDVDTLESVAPVVVSALERDRFSSGGFKAHVLQRWSNLRNRILSDLSHELRTPLANIKGYATALLRDDAQWSPDIQREFLETIEEQSDTLERLIAGLLDTTMLETGMFRVVKEPVLLPRLVSRVIHELELRTKNNRLVVEIDQDFPVIEADPARLAQVLWNLLDNAIKYSPDGGLIVVRASAGQGRVLVTIADQGVGIPPEHLNRLFERYYRIEENTQGMAGSGLGLPISREIIEAQGGQIWVESEVDKGTTIYFTLPHQTELEGE